MIYIIGRDLYNENTSIRIPEILKNKQILLKTEKGLWERSIQMKIKKLMLLGMAGVLVCFLSAGCGAKEEDGEQADGKTTLEFFSNKQESIATLEKLIDKFNAENNTVVVKLNAPADPDTVLKTRMAKGDMPDIIANIGASLFTELTASGFLADLTDTDLYKDINEVYMDMMYRANEGGEEVVYGIPYAANVAGIIYNKDLFEQYQMEIPHTWEALMEVCEGFQENGVVPFEMMVKTAWTSYAPWNALVAGIQPEDFVENRKAGKTSFADTHKEVVEKMSILADYAQEDFMGTSYEDGTRNFANGEAAMMIANSAAIPEIQKNNPDMNLDVFSFPSTEEEEKTKVIQGLDVILMLNKDCEDMEGAKEFIRFMQEPENLQLYIDEQASFSCVSEIKQSSRYVSGIQEDLNNDKIAVTTDYYYPNGLDIGAVMSEFYLNKTAGADEAANVEETLKKLDQQFDVMNN